MRAAHGPAPDHARSPRAHEAAREPGLGNGAGFRRPPGVWALQSTESTSAGGSVLPSATAPGRRWGTVFALPPSPPGRPRGAARSPRPHRSRPARSICDVEGTRFRRSRWQLQASRPPEGGSRTTGRDRRRQHDPRAIRTVRRSREQRRRGRRRRFERRPRRGRAREVGCVERAATSPSGCAESVAGRAAGNERCRVGPFTSWSATRWCCPTCRGVQPDDVRVLRPAQGGQSEAQCGAPVEDLQRDGSIQLELRRLVDRGGRAPSEEALDPEPCDLGPRKKVSGLYGSHDEVELSWIPAPK